MPFMPLLPEDEKLFPEPCRSAQHDPPSHVVIMYPMKWVCPECGASVILMPSTVRMVCAPISKPSGPRTRSQVMEERRTGPGGSGCCDQYANMSGCDCLETAVDDREGPRRKLCLECSGSGYAVHPENGWNRDARRCSRGCAVDCSICGNPDCDNPGGQH